MRRSLRRALSLAVALTCVPARAHDLITEDVAQRYLATLGAQDAIRRSTAPAPQRAEAAYRMGRTLDEIREFLNRDLSAHGQVQGLASNRLVLELKARGTPLSQLPDGRYAANLDYYHDALRLDPKGVREPDALFSLLQGHFYDSFDDDPLSPGRQSAAALLEQIALGERLMTRGAHPWAAEEARFIVLVHYVQAARTARDARNRHEYAGKARAAMLQFEKLYPDSLRAAALPVLRERLEEK